MLIKENRRLQLVSSACHSMSGIQESNTRTKNNSMIATVSNHIGMQLLDVTRLECVIKFSYLY